MSESNFDTNFESPVPPLRSNTLLKGRDPEWNKRIKRRLSVNFDYYLFTSVFFVLLAGAVFFDELVLYVLAILFAPLQIPLLAFCFNIAWQPVERWVNILFAWLFNIVGVFLVGYLFGMIIQQIPNKDIYVWRFFTEFSWANFLLIGVGTGLTFFIFQRNPNQNVLVANIAIVYSLYLPLVSAGIALATNDFNLFLHTMLNFLILCFFSICIGFVIILISKLTESNMRIIIFAILFFLLSSVFLYIKFLPSINLFDNAPQASINEKVVWTSTPNIGSTFENTEDVVLPTLINATITPTITIGVVKSPTATIAPTVTSTITLTPIPTPVWAQIQAREGDGANIRSEPDFTGRIVRTVLNGTLIQVLPDTVEKNGNIWVLVRLEDQVEGWIIRDLILSATPVPGW